MTRPTEFVTPHTRAATIMRSLIASDEAHLMRRGIKMEFHLLKQPDFEGARLKWRARIQKMGIIYMTTLKETSR